MSQESDSTERVRRHRAKKQAYEAGYALEPNKHPDGTAIFTGEAEVAWANGVWQRHADRATAGAVDKQDADPRPEAQRKKR